MYKIYGVAVHIYYTHTRHGLLCFNLISYHPILLFIDSISIYCCCCRFDFQIGITVDNSIINMHVVLANGSYVKTSRTQHPELFWALRGAGSALGVVTKIKYQLYDYSPISARTIIARYDEETFRKLITLYVNQVRSEASIHPQYMILHIQQPILDRGA